MKFNLVYTPCFKFVSLCGRQTTCPSIIDKDAPSQAFVLLKVIDYLIRKQAVGIEFTKNYIIVMLPKSSVTFESAEAIGKQLDLERKTSHDEYISKNTSRQVVENQPSVQKKPMIWRDAASVEEVIANFPKQPTTDDLIDLWAVNKKFQNQTIADLLTHFSQCK